MVDFFPPWFRNSKNKTKIGSNKDRFNALFDFFSMSFGPGQELTKDKHVYHLENSIPDDKLLPTNGGPIHLPTSERVLKRFYASEGKCALWVFPYHCIQFKNSLKGNAITEDQLNDSPDLSSGQGMKIRACLISNLISSWPRGLMDMASDFESGSCGFESHRGQKTFFLHPLKRIRHRPNAANNKTHTTAEIP